MHQNSLQELHQRFEPLLLFFIDGASLIDAEDDKWEVLLPVIPPKDGNKGGIVVSAALGYVQFMGHINPTMSLPPLSCHCQLALST